MCQLGASVIGEKVSVSKLFGAFFATLFGVDQTPLLMEMLSSFESIHRDQLKVASQVHCPSTWGLGLQPLYRALKSFGKIIKSIFILRYIDEVELRQVKFQQRYQTRHGHFAYPL
jgi:Tn3 transposase DDE domain